MRRGTVCFVVQDNQMLLALIHYPSGLEQWNGIGGWIEEGESPEDAVVREVQEETFLKVTKEKLRKVAELQYPEYMLDVFFTNTYNGELKAKEPSVKELRWFNLDTLPISQMHEGTMRWLPAALDGKDLVVTKFNE